MMWVASRVYENFGVNPLGFLLIFEHFCRFNRFFRARGKNSVLHSSSSSFVERDCGGMSKDPVGDMWDAPELSQGGKHLYPLQESGQGRMVIAYAFTLLSCYFHPFSSSCVTLSKFRLLFPFGVYPVSPFSFLFMRRMESVLDFSICFQARFLTGPIGVMIHLGFFFCQFSNLFSVT